MLYMLYPVVYKCCTKQKLCRIFTCKSRNYCNAS